MFLHRWEDVDNVVIATKGLQDRNTSVTAGTTVENKGKLISKSNILVEKPYQICHFRLCHSTYFFFQSISHYGLILWCSGSGINEVLLIQKNKF